MIKSRYDEDVDPVKVKAFNEEQKDWTAICRLCHKGLTGSLAEIRGHVCGKPSK